MSERVSERVRERVRVRVRERERKREIHSYIHIRHKRYLNYFLTRTNNLNSLTYN